MCVQVNAYLDNRIDVQTLLTDSEIKVAALEQIAELEESLAQVRYYFHCGDFFHLQFPERCHVVIILFV